MTVDVSLRSTFLKTSRSSSCERGQGYVYANFEDVVSAPIVKTPFTALGWTLGCSTTSFKKSASSSSIAIVSSTSDPLSDSSSDMSASESVATRSSSNRKSSSSSTPTGLLCPGAGGAASPNSAASSLMSDMSSSSSSSRCFLEGSSSSLIGSPLMRFCRFSSSSFKRSASSLAFSSAVFVRSVGFDRSSLNSSRTRRSYSLSLPSCDMVARSAARSAFIPKSFCATSLTFSGSGFLLM